MGIEFEVFYFSNFESRSLKFKKAKLKMLDDIILIDHQFIVSNSSRLFSSQLLTTKLEAYLLKLIKKTIDVSLLER